jgi:hypothetical protein
MQKYENRILEPCVVQMVRAKFILSDICEKDRNEDYQYIVSQIGIFLQKYCNHEIVKDLIDTTPDTSETIHYCMVCEETFIAR